VLLPSGRVISTFLIVPEAIRSLLHAERFQPHQEAQIGSSDWLTLLVKGKPSCSFIISSNSTFEVKLKPQI
jgi:hypothetical protein